ncbi:MAG: cation:proton antiporter [Phenylobacterium sp.]|uniref:cation:proton antiporter domain-containing protein n=1 Tax=Phenylobacterium sp. TaxID=1871053 RepID=UPI001B6945F1|nr:cation:proton antiporter [Phenylobacterium sp.]MBP7650709.1 cation:proton antiporter [Phenylobacterium sp.]MBP7816703.1 cation:proton antiporter [Phenylobacterium sp.]MBP9231552.1 cation:proton antiporter [Phenylobacterium sp.]MBP9755113.1 cation:proton antiporter [Phenylobacterium sp.]
MEGHVSPGEYKDVILFLATAGVIVPLFRRWRVSPILGFLGAGVVLGPFGLGALSDAFPWVGYFTIDNPDEVAQLAEFGVVFLLFMIGLELSWERLRLMRRFVFGMGALQVGLCVAAIAGIAISFGVDPVAAVAIGSALALSSTAVVMPILTEQKRQHSTAGRATFSVLLFQDLAVAPILITLALLGRSGGDQAFSPKMLLAFAPAVLGILGLVAFGRLLLRPMLKSVARAKSEELFMAACLLVVIGAGLVSALTGLSMALGAFIAGLLLAETEYRHEVEVTIEPFKGLLLGLFFVSVGIGLDLSILAAKPLLVLGMAIGMIVLNASVVFGLARLFGLRSPPAIEAGLLLAGGGEFAFVILAAAMGDGIVDRAIGQTVLVSSTLSMMCIPLLAALGLKLGGRKTQGEGLSPDPAPVADGEKPRVLVVGYGRVGRLVGEMLNRHDIPWVAAERDPRLVEAARRAGESIFFGDASRPEFLKRCGLETAPSLVVTMDAPEGVEVIVATARQMRPDLTIVARARDARHAQRLYELGATDAVPETVEASLQLSEAVLVEIGVPMGLIIASIHERRDEFRKSLNRPEALGGRARRYRRNMET